MKINRLVDDIDGSVDEVQTIAFAVAGKHYEVDLSAENRELFSSALHPFIRAARPLTRATSINLGVKRPTNRVRTAEENAEIREWARKNGYPRISDRGRVPVHVINAYIDAHPED